MFKGQEGPLEWKQTLNPTETSPDGFVDGYEPIELNCDKKLLKAKGWGGLRYEPASKNGQKARIDGSTQNKIGHYWFFAIMGQQAYTAKGHGTGMPACNKPVSSWRSLKNAKD